MDETTTNQKGNIVLGDQAGRDLTKNYIFDASQPTPMGCLIEKLKRERENDRKFSETLAILKRYISPPPGESVDGLEFKVKAANREVLLDYAKRAKEVFAKKLMEHQFSETAQEILAYLLAEIYTRFHNHVLIAIQNRNSSQEVNLLVQTLVIDPVQALLEENPLCLYAEEINGMLYYLTGNCHIKWVK
jgi:hypothetical protein